MINRKLLLTGTVGMVVALAGCFQGEQTMEEIDPPMEAEEVDQLEDPVAEENEDSENVEEEEESEAVEDVHAETVPREIYLIDSTGMVASQVIELPKIESKEVATQVLEHLVKGGPVTSMLPNGFQAVLPEGTEIIGLNLQEDGTMVVDLSEEFKNYQAEDEVKILEAMTHTLTQFENVERIKLWINGEPLDEMPVDGTPIENGYTRANGINYMNTDTVDLTVSEAITMFYPAEHNDNRYFVPVTQYVEGTEGEFYSSIVEELVNGPKYNNNLIHVFNGSTMLTENPTLQEGILELTFNQSILSSGENSVIADEVMETLVRTLTEQEGVEGVHVQVENVDQLVNENGEAYTEPVTKQAFVETEEL
jgi:germination protein M